MILGYRPMDRFWKKFWSAPIHHPSGRRFRSLSFRSPEWSTCRLLIAKKSRICQLTSLSLKTQWTSPSYPPQAINTSFWLHSEKCVCSCTCTVQLQVNDGVQFAEQKNCLTSSTFGMLFSLAHHQAQGSWSSWFYKWWHQAAVDELACSFLFSLPLIEIRISLFK